MSHWTVRDLADWDSRIKAKAEEFGLNPYPQEFEICDWNQMIGYMAYSGMPSRYHHWSFGKQFEKIKTEYEYGVAGLPYEMVINSNPCLAYLTRDNTLALQILTMAHVYGHNDFFKNNLTFQFSNPGVIETTLKIHAERVRSYIEDPSIGQDKVENFLEDAHSLSLNCRRNPRIKKLTKKEQQEVLKEKFKIKIDEYQQMGIHQRKQFDEEGYLKAIAKNPLEPEEDILSFISENGRFLEDWERDLLKVVNFMAQYFLPQIETKIMNEGWASWWHYRILKAINLPQDIYLEFMVHHSQVIRPWLGNINPYCVGFQVWRAIRTWYNGFLDRDLLNKDEGEDILFDEMVSDYRERNAIPANTGLISGDEMIFVVREAERDSSFLRNWLTPVLLRRLGLFEYGKEENKDGIWYVVTEVPDQDNWEIVRDTFVRNVGMNAMPVIKIDDINHKRHRALLLVHDYDDRDLDLEYTKHTLIHLKNLWKGNVTLHTFLKGEPKSVYVNGRDLVIKSRQE